MSRKTFMIVLRIAAIIILAVVLVPKIIDYLNQPDEEETVIGYSSTTVPAEVTEILEEGEVTLGEVTQPYQIVEVQLEEGEYGGLFFEIEYGTRQIRNEMILLSEGDKLMVTVSTMPTGEVNVQFTDFYRTNS
ncbi:MAG: hypothetical protein H0S82_05845, partial [Anaerolineaceae bacterium]|nr:hypothetical protein [Anaerolineaceae bacterium]